MHTSMYVFSPLSPAGFTTAFLRCSEPPKPLAANHCRPACLHRLLTLAPRLPPAAATCVLWGMHTTKSPGGLTSASLSSRPAGVCADVQRHKPFTEVRAPCTASPAVQPALTGVNLGWVSAPPLLGTTPRGSQFRAGHCTSALLTVLQASLGRPVARPPRVRQGRAGGPVPA